MSFRPYLFLSGEHATTMPLVFSKWLWNHTMTASELIFDEKTNTFRRSNIPSEKLKGIIFYADMDDKEKEYRNLLTIKTHNISCYPNVNILLRMFNRHEVMEECVNAGFISHEIYQLLSDEINNFQFNYPVVLKTGNSHRGIDKFLIKNKDEFPSWEGIATIEPFFEGASVRVLLIGDQFFGTRIDNEESWIKNSPGADISDYYPGKTLVQHAKAVAKYFELDIAGVDYIVDSRGDFHFLEINQFPGISGSDEISDAAKKFLSNKMDSMEISN